VFLTRGMLSNNAAATAGKGEILLHLGRARKKGPFPNFSQRGTPLISGLLVVVRDRRGESPLSSRAESRTLRSVVKGSRIIGATEPVNARSEKSTRERTIYPRRLRW
jgi:hypothetical protein